MRVFALIIVLFGQTLAQPLFPLTRRQIAVDNYNLDFHFQNTQIDVVLYLNNVAKLSARLGEDIWDISDGAEEECNEFGCSYTSNNVTLNASIADDGFLLSWSSPNKATEFKDCINLNSTELSWYGGPEKWQQDWPVEKIQFKQLAYTTRKSDAGAVSERYWLNSVGGFVFVEDNVPLFIDQNNLRDDSLCFIGAAKDPYVNRERSFLTYRFLAADNPKEAQQDAVDLFLGKPSGLPAPHIIKHPIWTTWAKYKKEITDEIVVAFAEDIAKNGFGGQIEIDDYWETCYGSLIFNDIQFPQISTTVASLKALNFTVTLWTHPFVNSDCEEPSKYGAENGLFIRSFDGGDETSWWDGSPAHHIDFTKAAAAKWFTDRLEVLQAAHGIDSFKFDAGECDYPPLHPIASGDLELAPNSITAAYVRTVSQFGGLIEVRSAWRTQDLPILLRMLDKDSRWGLDNGLHSLITTLLQFNINGYVMVLPDMIGGNGYNEKPNAELLARWTQANTFMPTMQFSYLPWEITSDEFDSMAIVKKFVSLHEFYSEQILDAMQNAVNYGTPVNPPIWWLDPTNEDALKVNDQYLLGETILVAPVIVEGARSRNVVLPTGNWIDGNTGETYKGPTILKDYPAPIDVLPYFILDF